MSDSDNNNYSGTLVISPNEDNYEVVIGDKEQEIIDSRVFSPMVTQAQWDSCDSYSKGSSVNPEFSLKGYKETYYLSDIKASVNNESPLYLTAEYTTLVGNRSEENGYIRSRHINYYVNGAIPNTQGSISFDRFIVDTLITDSNGHAEGTFIVPSGEFKSGNYAIYANIGSINIMPVIYKASFSSSYKLYYRNKIPVGVLVEGKFYGIKETN